MGVADYLTFLERRAQARSPHGIVPRDLPEWLFPFQRDLVQFALHRGSSAMFADCGLGKTPMQLVWADQIVRATNKRVLILTPLAVSYQTIEEAAKFQIEATRVQGGRLVAGINVTNYEQLAHYDPQDFVGVVCDESSILKSFDGVRKSEVIAFLRKMPYRLLATATAAPNDYIELGNSSEALGELGYMDMLAKFFKNENNSYTRGGVDKRGLWARKQSFRFKGYAEQPFWRWVASWARALRQPSDLGYVDDRFVLPPLAEAQHLVNVAPAHGMLFALAARDLNEQRAERRRSIRERCEKVAALVNDGQPALVWCHLNEEGRLLASLIPDAVEVAGSDSDEAKEERLLAFVHGQIRVLVTKPKIGAWGLNCQHCAHVTFFPSHSFEQYYQGVRRCWRFGQTRPVRVDIITTEGESEVMANLTRKAQAASRMFDSLVREMVHASSLQRPSYQPTPTEIPSWLTPSSATTTPSISAIA